MTLVLRGALRLDVILSFTIRDNVVGGQTASDLMTLTATDAAGPL
jgi:hypothetical protein